jgi:acetoacetyl-CoA synthetase
VSDVLWQPSFKRMSQSQMHKFLQFVNQSYNLNFATYPELYQWSIDFSDKFWTTLFLFFQPIYEGNVFPAYGELDFFNYSWFPNLNLNFAENLLRFSDTSIALNCQNELGKYQNISYKQLHEQTAKLQNFLKKFMTEGDVLASLMPNISETVVGMLATSSLGGIFTATSPDFGVESVIDRFGQTEPKVLLVCLNYFYNGKTIDLRGKVTEIIKRLPSLKAIVSIDCLSLGYTLNGATAWRDIQNQESPTLYFKRIPFKSPLFIMYTSGTTGKPKCIVHSQGGVLLQIIKDLGLHTDLNREKKILYFTTCGWMMWNWLVTGLYFGSEVVLYDGSPSYPSLNHFMEMIDRERVHIFGTSPKYLRALEDAKTPHNLKFDALETILSTGSPLNPSQYDFVYQYIKKDVQLSSISGGTDILSCFVLGNPLLPVRRGEIQCIGLGMDVAAYNEQGQEVYDQEGELVCKKSFPSQPIGFWKDENQQLFKKVYLQKFPGVWCHGDFISISKDKSVRIYGRSDATLKPGGVRIGTGEIYAIVESIPYIVDSICVGQNSQGDVRVILFVKMKSGEPLTPERIDEIKQKIKQNASPRHVPSIILEVKAIPYTFSGKKMEIIVSRIVNGRDITNIEAVSNPDCLDEYGVSE